MSRRKCRDLIVETYLARRKWRDVFGEAQIPRRIRRSLRRSTVFLKDEYADVARVTGDEFLGLVWPRPSGLGVRVGPLPRRRRHRAGAAPACRRESGRW